MDNNKKLFWNFIFVVIMCGIGYGTYLAAQQVEYDWNWQRLPQYIINTEPELVVASFDGDVIEADGTITLVDTNDTSSVQALPPGAVALAGEGDLIFAGDPIGEIKGWRIGPLLKGLIVTLQLSIVSLFFSVIIGVIAGLARISKNPAIRNLSIVYIELIRGTPLLVQLLIVYFFVGRVFDLERFTAGVLALSLFTGAYIAEIVRSGVQSIANGQTEAARSLGMNSFQTMRHVILPQALKITLPPMAGQFINLIKDSSLVSVIAITDLTKAGREVVASTLSPFEVYFTVALFYLLLTGMVSIVVQYLERRMALSDGR